VIQNMRINSTRTITMIFKNNIPARHGGRESSTLEADQPGFRVKHGMTIFTQPLKRGEGLRVRGFITKNEEIITIFYTGHVNLYN